MKRFFKYFDEPRHWNSPLTMIPKRVHRASHSSMLFDERRMVFPELRAFVMTFHRFRLVDASIPIVGSSDRQPKIRSKNMVVNKITIMHQTVCKNT